MKDVYYNLTKWIDHNRGTFIALFLPTIFGLAAAGGCLESKTSSLADSNKMVNRQQFNVEVAIKMVQLEQERFDLQNSISKFNAKVVAVQERIDTGFDTLDAGDLRNEKLFESLGGLALGIAQGGITPAGIVTSSLSLMGILYGVGKRTDNKRKDNVIADLKIRTSKEPS